MSPNTSILLTRYLEICRAHEMQPSSAVVSWLKKAIVQKATCQKCTLVISLDQLTNADLLPLTDLFHSNDSDMIDAVDLLHESSVDLTGYPMLSLMHAINTRLRVVDIRDMPLKDVLRDLFETRLDCRVLNIRSTEIQKLNMAGRFMHMHTLNLDFCTSITTMEKDCFTYMPNLIRLSMCATRVSNLWTAAAALSKLPSLLELRFQNCLCCNDTAPCHLKDFSEASTDILIEGAFGKLHVDEQESGHASQKYNSHHPSPVCFQKHYREYMIVSLPRLGVLDNCRIGKFDRDRAKTVFSRHYELLPNKRQHKESILSVLHMRETGTSSILTPKSLRSKVPSLHKKSQSFYSRSLCAAKLGSSAWPLLHPISNISEIPNEEGNVLRPRQFEYHQTDPSLMAFGTLEGEVVVINHETGNLVNYVPSFDAHKSVLGLCWLKRYPSKVKQLLAVDGRLHTNFDIAPTGNTQNYTRSYYMNGRDYIISGSCDEPVVRICCAQTGRRLRDVYLEGQNARSLMFVQSLRGDPFRHFHMAILAAYVRPSSKWEIIKVNLLSSDQNSSEYKKGQHLCPSYRLGT